MQPRYEHNLHMYIYFTIFVICALFLPLSMLVGVIVSNFNKQKIKISINIHCMCLKLNNFTKYFKNCLIGLMSFLHAKNISEQ